MLRGKMKRESYYESDADKVNHFYFAHLFNENNRAHFHNSVEMVVVVKGEFFVCANGEKKTLHAGDVFFADSYVTHIYKSTPETELYVMVISDSYQKNFQSIYEGVFPMFMESKEDGNCLLIKACAFFSGEWQNCNLLMRTGFVNWVLGYLADRYPPETKKKSDKSYFIVNVLKYIEDNYDKNISVAEIASKFGYSPNHFSMLFNKYINLSFRTYLNRYRVQQVMKKIKEDPDMGIGKACELCGFNSPNTYYRALHEFDNFDF